MFNNHFKQSDQGFVRIIVILIILMLIFTFAGFNFQESVSVERLLTNLENLWSKLKALYNDTARTLINDYLISPASTIYHWINNYIIDELTKFLKEIINRPPIR